VALLIGELHYMTRLNAVTSHIVEHAVACWRARPSAVLVCEAAPMAALARSLGVPAASMRVAIPEAGGHTTRWAAERIRAMPVLGDRTVLLVTHRLHGPRAARMFRAVGLQVQLEGLDLPFDRRDPDWKLRSPAIFRFYNAGAWVYCFARGWL
jgi:hypothetical protein